MKPLKFAAYVLVLSVLGPLVVLTYVALVIVNHLHQTVYQTLKVLPDEWATWE